MNAFVCTLLHTPSSSILSKGLKGHHASKMLLHVEHVACIAPKARGRYMPDRRFSFIIQDRFLGRHPPH